MENYQKGSFQTSDFQRYGVDHKGVEYIQNQKAIQNGSGKNNTTSIRNNKLMNRRLKSGNTNNRINLSAYTSSQNFVDPFAKPKQKTEKSSRAKSIKDKQKPSTSYHEKRQSNLNEQGSGNSIKDSIVASIKQTIADEEAKADSNLSFSSDKPNAKAVLPAVDHEKSKRKIDDLLFKPSDCMNSRVPKSKGDKPIQFDGVNKNGPETNLNDMPDLTTFDNRNSAAMSKLIGSKMKEHQNGNVPNKSMRNLNLGDDDTLPIYKRRTGRKGPVKLTDNSYISKPSHDTLSSKRKQNSSSIVPSSNENINEMNQKNEGRGKSTRLGRQQTDFRIIKTKTSSKIRTGTANNRRNPSKATLTSCTNLSSNIQFEMGKDKKPNASSN